MKILKYGIWLFSITLIVIIAFFAFTKRIRVVTGSSMEPTYQPGDVLFIGFKPKNIEPGMILSYEFQSKSVTHRVININPDGSLILKGDNNENIDPKPVQIEQILGSPLVHIPRLGYLFKFIREPLGFILFIIIPVCLIIMDRIIDGIKSVRKIEQ